MDNQENYYKQIFSQRLYDLSEEYVNRKKQEIKEQNKEIEKQNKEIREKAKLQILNVGDYQFIKKLKTYSLEKLVKDIEDKYQCGINSRNFNLYRRNESFPDDPYMVYAFADFFNVSLEYMYGFSDTPNALNNKVQETIHLNSTAINTLISYNENQIVLTVMNALLSDKDSSAYLFMNLYEEAYQKYKQEHSIGSAGEFDTEILLKKFISAESLSRYLEKYLLPLVREDFKQRLESEMNDDDFRSLEYDEYEAKMIEDIQYSQKMNIAEIETLDIVTPKDNAENRQ